MEEQQIDQIKKRLRESLPGSKAQELMMGRVRPMPMAVPANARPSAVLCLIFPLNGEPHILFMKRREDNTPHSGQVSFPGGSYEQNDADYRATALREANEEVGIMAADVDILGALTSLYIPVSNFNVYPYVGFSAQRPAYNLSQAEVSYILEVPVSDLSHPSRKEVTHVTSPAMPDVKLKVNAYVLQDSTIIWGATAMILSELEAVLRDAGLLPISSL
ncbi:coenzyme A pyrophosphatase [Flavipsychrobacter stenotrophus]|uniref:Coenzyme A pyrophosphatase n=1 Tax=Flavipsychrobacter stenotrophus TaxID=2077091 RepID=A0A2S7SYM8_9BACT|nr:CoA pyrophosphatase [Flavipsychrobacter stenotrophus]PQJ12053.1 coenzyme A pyrophosphatase [Flavipsychrobacter stenotrophus]